MTLTTRQAAEVLGIGDSGVRMLVKRGHLTPVRPGARPHRFREIDVWALSSARVPAAEKAHSRAAWDRICEMIPG